MMGYWEKTYWKKIDNELPPLFEKIILRFIERGNIKKNIVSLVGHNEWVLHGYRCGTRMDRGEFTPTHWITLPPEPRD